VIGGRVPELFLRTHAVGDKQLDDLAERVTLRYDDVDFRALPAFADIPETRAR
jgi:hypothetical protein